MSATISKEAIQSVVRGRCAQPAGILGMHPLGGQQAGVSVRTFQPYAKEVAVVPRDGGDPRPMSRVHNDGFFELSVPGAKMFDYRLRMTGFDGHTWELDDPYRFPPQITDFDLYLFGEGTHFRTYKKMGAHPLTVNGVEGVHFAVWAPNARRVSVIGVFNRWDGRHTPMQNRGSSGLWEVFVPALKPGDIYKYEILGPNDYLTERADPYAFACELRPKTASVIWDIEWYTWQDKDWMSRRRETRWHDKPISVYEVHPGSWRRNGAHGEFWYTYRQMADTLIPYVKDTGYTHIELLPISEHPFDGSWGYQTIGYYAPTSRFGTPDDLKYFIDRCHQEGIGVILDWVPAHFPKDGHGLGYFDGTHLYEHSDPRKGEHMDWGTLIFNYGRNEVRTFLLANAMFWADVYHIDGIRVDAVASMLYLDYSRKAGEWIPNQFGGRENLEAVSFLKKFNELIHGEYPGFITFAEESTAWPMVSRPTYLGGLGFDFKWNMGWMNDTLAYIEKEPVHRKYHHGSLTFSLIYAFTENFILPFSHDEVVHGKRSMLDKMPGDFWQKFANLRVLYAYMYAHPGKKLLFMGCEFGQWLEWNCNQSLDWHLLQFEPHQKLLNCVKDLNRVYKTEKSMHEIDFNWEGFQWIDLHDSEQSIISFLRRAKNGDVVACIFNLTPVPRTGYRMGVPKPGKYREIFNSDSNLYGGSNMGNAGEVPSDPIPWQGQPHSLLLTLPPLGALFLKPS
ncbi:MAG: 1,4-alpha-glucan branching protein GlgB [Kiritimatiellia bacterium]